jgi:hypothetical protein
MNILFAMGTPTTSDSTGYFLLLPHLWPLFVIPLVCFYFVLTVWVIRKIREARAILPESSEEHAV